MVTLALIGIGKWGQNYLQSANSLKGVRIKYICAQTQQHLNSLPNTYIKTTSTKDLLKNKDIDGFIIATPATAHFAIAKQLLSLNHNILIEKPLATNYQQALQLQKIWRIKKPKVLVGHLYLYNPAYLIFKKLFKRIKTVRSIHFEGSSSPFRKDVSIIWDWGPHPISILLDLIKQPPKEIIAHGSYDTVNILIKFSNNIKTSIHISWQGSDKVRKLTVEGEEEKIELDDTDTSDKKVALYKFNTKVQYLKCKTTPPLTEELTEFVQAIKYSNKIRSDINMGVKVTRILAAIEHSVDNNGRVV